MTMLEPSSARHWDELHRGGGRSRTSGSPGLQEFDIKKSTDSVPLFQVDNGLALF